ncbi:Bor family protein [bacterium]|nr:Bor family protein [bacterium]
MMSKRFMLSASCMMLIAIFCAGCWTFNQIGVPGETPIEITNSDRKSSVAHFVRSKKVNHWVFGLVSPDNAGVEQIISDEVRANGGSKAVNIRMKYQHTFVDGLVRIITLGIYSPVTLKVEGDVVR